MLVNPGASPPQTRPAVKIPTPAPPLLAAGKSSPADQDEPPYSSVLATADHGSCFPPAHTAAV